MNAMFTQMITLLSKGVLAAGALLAVWVSLWPSPLLKTPGLK